jgi:hypothetical protein
MDSMDTKPSMKGTGFFLLRVFVIYIVLLLPWSGLSMAYNAWFRSLGRVSALGGAWIVRVEAVPAEEKSPLTTRFHVGNPQMTDSQGNIMGKVLGLDSWGVGWVPTALVLSLIAATRLPMRRRLTALAWGLLLINLYITFCLRVYLWDETADLFNTGSLARSISGALSYTLVTQMGAGFAVAVLIWLAVTFRAHDALLLTSTLAATSPPQKAKRQEH